MTVLRPFAPADAEALDALVDADDDPLVAAQSRALHGADRDGGAWRRTLVAEWDDRLAGVVTVARNAAHPGRYSCALQVVPALRRRGLGRTLVDAALELRPEPLLLSAKLRPQDSASRGLLRSVGGTVYQRCPGVVLDPADERLRGWCLAHRGSVEVVRAENLPVGELAALWTRQYEWVHERWSPVEITVLSARAGSIIAEADLHRSLVAVRRGRPVAVAWLFPTLPDEPDDVVVETTERDTPNGAALVAALLAELIGSTRTTIALDGHETDPHLGPAVRTLPPQPANPLWLVEF